jgi:unsaturated pyranuronate lyase
MPFFDTSDMTKIEPVQGWVGHSLHGERMTLTHYEIAAGAPDVHEHYHPHEEAWSILDGRLAVWVDGEERTLGPGEVAVIPPNVRHRVRAVTRSRALVVDSPARHRLPGSAHRA